MVEGVCSGIFDFLAFGLFSWVGANARRRHALKLAGVDKHGSRAGEWSPDAIAAVLVAIDPGRLAPSRGESGIYDATAHEVFSALPVFDPGDRDHLEAVLRRSIDRQPDTSIEDRAVRQAVDRLCEMHSLAFGLLQEDE